MRRALASARGVHTSRGKIRRLSSSGYQSIGSFHSENLAELMSASDADYNPPSLPFRKDTPDHPSDFMLDLDSWTFLNHGAFGAALTIGYNRAEQWRRYMETQPLRFFDRDLLPHLAHSARLLANFIHIPQRENLTLLQNVTAGLNSVIAGYVREFGSSSHIILWDTSYGSVKKMAKYYCGANAVTEIPLQAEYLDRLVDDPEMVLQQALEESVTKASLQGKTPLLILDHTTSNTALTFPIERLAAQMKESLPGSIVLVDGAHGLLAQRVDMKEMPSVDLYLSNGHKWLSAPRGVAMMALQDTHWKDTLLRQPAVISHGVDETDLLSRFVWDGTRDYSAALALPVILQYWKRQGLESVQQKLKNQLGQGIRILAEHWHPDYAQVEAWPGVVTLTSFDSSVLSPMALVSLPATFGENNTSLDAKRIQDYLFENQIEAPIKCINGKLFTRVSCHVYNNANDFQILGETIRRYHQFP